jgi:hypothetical protein
MDAMVPDDGGQDRFYQPNPAQFPRGLDDLEALSTALEAAGTHLGLWIALNGYTATSTGGGPTVRRSRSVTLCRQISFLTPATQLAQSDADNRQGPRKAAGGRE